MPAPRSCGATTLTEGFGADLLGPFSDAGGNVGPGVYPFAVKPRREAEPIARLLLANSFAPPFASVTTLVPGVGWVDLAPSITAVSPMRSPNGEGLR